MDCEKNIDNIIADTKVMGLWAEVESAIYLGLSENWMRTS
jgi:hypothetical protein